jgi:hypothetical protein
VTLPKQGGGSEVVKTCPAAMGFGFAAGTTDGPGAFDFTQGDDKVLAIAILYRLGIVKMLFYCSGIVSMVTVQSDVMSGKSFLEVGAQCT